MKEFIEIIGGVLIIVLMVLILTTIWIPKLLMIKLILTISASLFILMFMHKSIDN